MKKRNIILVLILINLVVSTTSPMFAYGLRFPLLGMTVKGTIYKSGTATTISNAKISLIVAGTVNGITYSDASGAYSISYKGDLLTNPISGQLKVEKSGYYTKTVNTIIPAIGQPPTIENVYLTLIPVTYNYAVTAVVKNFDGYRIANAIVTLSGYDKSDQAVTNAYGVCGVGITFSTGGERTFTLTTSHHPNPVEIYQDYTTAVTLQQNIPKTKEIIMIEGISTNSHFDLGYFENPIENYDFRSWEGPILQKNWIISGGYEKSDEEYIDNYSVKSTGDYSGTYFEMLQEINDPYIYRHYLGYDVIFSFNVFGHDDFKDKAKAGIRYAIDGVWCDYAWSNWIVPDDTKWFNVVTSTYIPENADSISIAIIGSNLVVEEKFDSYIDYCNFGISYYNSYAYNFDGFDLAMTYGFEIYSIQNCDSNWDEIKLATTIQTTVIDYDGDDDELLNSNSIWIEATGQTDLVEIKVGEDPKNSDLDQIQTNDKGVNVDAGEGDLENNRCLDVFVWLAFFFLGIFTAGTAYAAGVALVSFALASGAEYGVGFTVSTLIDMDPDDASASDPDPEAMIQWHKGLFDPYMAWMAGSKEVLMKYKSDPQEPEDSEIGFRFHFKGNQLWHSIQRYSFIYMIYFEATKSWEVVFI